MFIYSFARITFSSVITFPRPESIVFDLRHPGLSYSAVSVCSSLHCSDGRTNKFRICNAEKGVYNGEDQTNGTSASPSATPRAVFPYQTTMRQGCNQRRFRHTYQSDPLRSCGMFSSLTGCKSTARLIAGKTTFKGSNEWLMTGFRIIQLLIQ